MAAQASSETLSRKNPKKGLVELFKQSLVPESKPHYCQKKKKKKKKVKKKKKKIKPTKNKKKKKRLHTKTTQ
jgi:hypothetical protein